MKPNNHLMRKNLIFGFLILSLLRVSLMTKAADPLPTPVELGKSDHRSYVASRSTQDAPLCSYSYILKKPLLIIRHLRT